MEAASRRRRYLVGVSGGADSVALLHGLVRGGFKNLIVCHLDHRLRGRASTEDARFVGRLAEKLGMEGEIGRVEVAARAREEAVSLETAGRIERHRFFAECAKRHRCPRLLLAHHRDDQAETVLWNLLRGSRAASGMEPVQEMVMAGRRMEVIRPLLEVRREALHGWLEAEGLRWREDASNAEGFAVRNRLRHEVLPLLSDIAERDPVEALAKAAETGAELRELERWAVEQAAAVDPQGRLHLGRLRELPFPVRRACVFAYLRNAGVEDLGRGVLGRVMAMLAPWGAARLDLPGGRTARRRQGRLWVE